MKAVFTIVFLIDFYFAATQSADEVVKKADEK
jgi:hypothetical protein